MMLVLPAFVLEHEFIFGLRGAESVHKPLPDIVHRQRRRMDEVIGIEAVVAQFIEHYFVRFEIMSLVVSR